jgi:hypothetical protein
VTYELPFRYGSPVDDPFFCDREDELKILLSRMRGGIHVFLLSPRRYGKSSLLDRSAHLIQKEGGRCASVNLLRCTNEAELAGSVLSAVVRHVMTRRGRAKHSLEDLLKRVRIAPRVSLSHDKVELSFDTALAGQDWVGVLQDAIAILESAADKTPAVLILDEFQVVASIGPKGVGGAFKALADQAHKASLVFSGSHLSVMEKLTKAQGAPLLGMGERIVLAVIPEAEMTAFLIRRSKKFDKRLSTENAALIYAEADAIPNYVQQLALAAFEAADGEIDAAAVYAGADGIVDRQVGDFAERFEQLAPSQQRTLKVLAAQPTKSVFTKSFMDNVGVANANAVRTALDVLGNRELVSRTAGVWVVSDPFLRRWLRRPLD